MERNTQKRRSDSNPRRRITHEDLRNLLKRLQKIMDRLGYGPSRGRPRAQPARYQSAIASVPSQRGTLNVRTSYVKNEVPVFNTYEEYHKMVLQSFENISIVLNIDGKVVFVSQNVTPLLGHRPEDIIGTSLLNLVPDEQKDDVSEKIILNLPLAHIVGSLIEFCCYIRKGNVGQSGQDRYRHKAKYQERDIYEYVKFILYLQDSYDESFVFFGNYGPSSRNIWSSSPRLLWEQQYYVVGNISVLRTLDESAQPVNIQTNAVVVDSDDDNTIQYHSTMEAIQQRGSFLTNTQNHVNNDFSMALLRLPKRRRRSEMQTDAQAVVVKVEGHPEAGTEVEILDGQPATQRMPFELVHVRTPSHSSTSTGISAATSISASGRSSTSSSSTDITSTTPASSPTSGQEYVIDPKYMLEPQDMEFEVGPEFLLNDSQEEQAPTEQGECTEEDVKKPLEEAKISNPKEHVIDGDSARHDASSDDDFCIIIEDTEDKKDPKVQEVIVGQEQGHQKASEAAPSCSTTPLQTVRPEAVVEPIVRTDLQVRDTEPRRTYQSQRSLLGERFAQLCGPRVMTKVYDLSISRSFHDEPPSYAEIEEEEREREQCEYELAQSIEMLRNLPYERPGQQQTGQGQGPRVYRPREQVVTVIDDVGPRPMDFFGSDNSQHSRNETHRRWEDPVDCAPPLLHHSSRSCQEMTASRQTSAASCQVLLPSCQVSAPTRQPSAPSCQVSARARQPSAPSCQVSARTRQPSAPSCQASAPSCQASAPSCQASAPSCQALTASRQVSAPQCQALAASRQASGLPCQASATSRQSSVMSQQVLAASHHHPSAMSHHTSSDHRRENRPCFLPPGQDHSGSFWAEEDTNPHPPP